MRGSTAGLAEGTIVTPDTVHEAFLVFLDVMFSSVIAAPVVIAYWRGTWNLMTLALFPAEKPIMGAITSTLIGTIGHFVFYYYQGKFSKTFHPDKHRITYMIFSRIYTAVYAVVCVNGWRGGWSLMDIYITDKTVPIYFSILMISCVLLAFCKCLRNISASPFAISTDHSKDYFAVPTMFKSTVWKKLKILRRKNVFFLDLICKISIFCFGLFFLCVCVGIIKASSDPGFYFIDCAFSVLIIGTLVIFVWRCMFALCDHLIYPTDTNLSAWYSLVSGPNFYFYFVIVHYSCVKCESVFQCAESESGDLKREKKKRASNFKFSNQFPFPYKF